MWSYSIDLRERIVAACESGQSVAEVALRFAVSQKTVRRYRARAAQGSLEPNRCPGRAPRLQPEQEVEFIAMVQEHPDFTLDQFCQEWERQSGVLLPRSTLHGHLQRLKGRLKKTRIAQERCEAKRAAFRAQIAGIALEKLVFLDEAGFSLNMHRLYGWTIGGGRCQCQVPFNKGKNRSVVGAYSLPSENNPTRLWALGLWALGQKLGAWTGRLYEIFLEEAVLPYVPKGSVLVMDNAKIHHGPELQKIVEAAGCSVLYLPPYSPDFNPIELVWSWIKAQVRLLAPRDDDSRQRDIWTVQDAIPASAAKGWFQKCGLT